MALLLLVASHAFAQVNASAKQPNILWITCEDMSPHLGCYGEKVAKTPNLDQLASEGIRYTRMFAVYGVCAPSRSSIITGMFPSSIGTQHHRTIQKVVDTDGKDGYPAGFYPYEAVVPAEVKCFPEYLRQAGYYCTNNAKTDYQFTAPETVWDENSNKAHWRNRPAGKPFFSVFNINVTHESQVWERKTQPILVASQAITVPPYYPDDSIVRREMAVFLSNVIEMDKQVGNILQQLKEDGLYENTIIFFFSDHGDGLPLSKREVYDRGTRVPFIVRLPGKAQAGKVEEELHSFIDLAPTILSLANITIPSHLQGKAFLGTQASTKPHSYLYMAKDRMDSETDRVRAVRDKRFMYVKNYIPEQPLYQNVDYRLQQAIMQDILRLKNEGKLTDQQLAWFKSPRVAEELYDCEVDPWQVHNLAGDPKYAKKLEELRKAHNQWLVTYNDLSAKPEMEMIHTMWPDGKQPKTTAPIISNQARKVIVSCRTAGASIGFRKKGEERWQVYTSKVQLRADEAYEFIAHRIGYLPSGVIVIPSGK